MGEIMIRALSRFAAPALALPRAVKRGVVLALDAGLCISTVWLTFYLRSGSFMPLASRSSSPIAREPEVETLCSHSHGYERCARYPRLAQRPGQWL